MSHDPEHWRRLAGEHTGQVEFAYLLAAEVGLDLLYVHGIGWHTWDGTRWALDYDDVEATRAVHGVLRKEWAASYGDDKRGRQIARLQTAAAVSGILAQARRLGAFAATVNELDADPYLLNTPAGTLDLRDFRARGHDPADRITKITTGSYYPASQARRGPESAWEPFLEQILPDPDVRAYLARFTGQALLGRVVTHVLMLLTGSGGNGKGTWYEAVVNALGEYAVTPEPGLLTQRRHETHPTGLMDLRGTRFAVVSETDQGQRFDESKMKRLTGGDKISARRMGQDFVEFTPSHSLALVTNHPPTVSGDDEAVWRRLRRVDFGVTIDPAHMDGHLGERLRLDADAVLTWAVEGLRDFYARGEKLDEPGAVLRSTADYKAENDATGRFIAEECLVGKHYWTPVGDLWERWCSWAAENGEPVGTQTAFGKELSRRGFTTDPGRRKRLGIALYAAEEEAS